MTTVGALVFDGFELLDLYGPLEILGLAEADVTIRLIAERDAPVASAQGPRALPDAGLGGGYDILLVPGGPGTRREVDNTVLFDQLARMAERAGTVASVCTGAALLARAGVLDGLRATTNKRAFDWVCAQGPRTAWQPRARWVTDGRIWTASGVSAGIDMAVALVEALHGADAAAAAATRAEYRRHPDPADDPFATGDRR